MSHLVEGFDEKGFGRSTGTKKCHFKVKTLNGICLICNIRPQFKDGIVILDKLRFKYSSIMGKTKIQKCPFGGDPIVCIDLTSTAHGQESTNNVSRSRDREFVESTVEEIDWLEV